MPQKMITQLRRTDFPKRSHQPRGMRGRAFWPHAVPGGSAAAPGDAQESLMNGRIRTPVYSVAAAPCPVLFLGKKKKIITEHQG